MLIRYQGLQQLSQLDLVPNTHEAELFSNIEDNAKRGLSTVEGYEPTDQPAVVVGSGPSVASTLEMIREMKERGARVFALNNAARYLFENGIKADVQIILDPRECNIDFVRERYSAEVLLASQCHASLFDHCAKIGYPVRIWHPLIPGIQHVIEQEHPLLIGGGLTVGLSGLCLIYTLGHRNLHLFGYDSCHSESQGHVLPQPMNDNDDMVRAVVDNRAFDCSLMMAGQANSFQRVAEMLADLDCEITLHGDGLIQHMMAWRQRILEQKILTAVYDLGVSPPTYDFFSFLAEADRHAKENGFTHIDLVFQPGPMFGFRDDNLPPDPLAREVMLQRVCVAGARLCPRVRNVTVLRERKEIEGDVFPIGWKEDYPISHYGLSYIINGNRCLTATAGAKREIKRKFPIKYATVTLRDSEYWPARNSNHDAAFDAAMWFMNHAITPIIVPDTFGKPILGHFNFVPASWDIDLRLALYESAVMNIGVTNGASTGLWTLCDAPYIAFKPEAEGSNATSREFFEAHGAYQTDWSPNGRVVWADDTSENILAALDDWHGQMQAAA